MVRSFVSIALISERRAARVWCSERKTCRLCGWRSISAMVEFLLPDFRPSQLSRGRNSWTPRSSLWPPRGKMLVRPPNSRMHQAARMLLVEITPFSLSKQPRLGIEGSRAASNMSIDEHSEIHSNVRKRSSSICYQGQSIKLFKTLCQGLNSSKPCRASGEV
jgi:hypothetical protein